MYKYNIINILMLLIALHTHNKEKSMTSIFTLEASNKQCYNGGTIYTTYIDKNMNEIYDDYERIISVKIICNF